MYLKKHICVFVCLYLYSFASPSSISHFSALNQISTCSPSLFLQVSFILDSFLDYCLKIALWIWNKKETCVVKWFLSFIHMSFSHQCLILHFVQSFPLWFVLQLFNSNRSVLDSSEELFKEKKWWNMFVFIWSTCLAI